MTMQLSATSEAKLGEVHPELSRRIHQLADMLSFPIIVTQGLRTWPQQDALYQQGRTTPGAIVTHAKPGHSMHNFALAVDVAPIDGSKIDWNGKDAKWQEILAKAPSCGLAEGAQWRTFPDEPHLYPQEVPANPDDNLRYLFTEGGIQAVWDYFKLSDMLGQENG
jgi:peptidoglycan L-alanyl-D-glutamate endopeptidase CwlK